MAMDEMSEEEVVRRLAAAFDGKWTAIPKEAMLIAVPEDWSVQNVADFAAFFHAVTGRKDVMFLPFRMYDISEIRNRTVQVLDNLMDVVGNLAADQPRRVLARQQIEGLRKKVAELRAKVAGALPENPSEGT